MVTTVAQQVKEFDSLRERTLTQGINSFDEATDKKIASGVILPIIEVKTYLNNTSSISLKQAENLVENYGFRWDELFDKEQYDLELR